MARVERRQGPFALRPQPFPPAWPLPPWPLSLATPRFTITRSPSPPALQVLALHRTVLAAVGALPSKAGAASAQPQCPTASGLTCRPVKPVETCLQSAGPRPPVPTPRGAASSSRKPSPLACMQPLLLEGLPHSIPQARALPASGPGGRLPGACSLLAAPQSLTPPARSLACLSLWPVSSLTSVWVTSAQHNTCAMGGISKKKTILGLIKGFFSSSLIL